jgi:hypothetical protein
LGCGGNQKYAYGSNEMTEGSNKHAHIDFDLEIESTAVAGAVAVQKLIADRNRLREELTTSLAAQADYRRQLQALHQRYIELARKVVVSMQQFDSTMREAMGGKVEVTDGSVEPKPQFDGNGLPLGTERQPNGNGSPNGTARLGA